MAKETKMTKLGDSVPTMYVTNKTDKDAPPMKINVADFNPKIHAKISDEGKAEPKPKPKATPKTK
jgi:hypothetical protein